MERNPTERERVEEAIKRLLDGKPKLSNGDHTIVALAVESEVKRARLYEQYQDLLADFRTRAHRTLSPKLAVAASHELVETRARAHELAAENYQLRQRIRTLSAIIAELSIHRDEKFIAPFRQ